MIAGLAGTGRREHVQQRPEPLIGCFKAILACRAVLLRDHADKRRENIHHAADFGGAGSRSSRQKRSQRLHTGVDIARSREVNALREARVHLERAPDAERR
jgi:hypothetical protein